MRGEKFTTIPYGAGAVTTAPVDPVTALGLESGRYLTAIARAEPENSILEVVQGFSKILEIINWWFWETIRKVILIIVLSRRLPAARFVLWGQFTIKL